MVGRGREIHLEARASGNKVYDTSDAASTLEGREEGGGLVGGL